MAITTIAQDDFNVDSGSNWGTADTGGAWTNGASGTFSVSGGKAIVACPSNVRSVASLEALPTTVASSQITFKCEVDKTASTYGNSIGIQSEFRGTAGMSTFIAIRFRVNASGNTVTPLIISEAGVLVTGSNIKQTDNSTDLVFAANTQYSFKIESINEGTVATDTNFRVRGKMWLTSGSEPTIWHVESTVSDLGQRAAGYLALGLRTGAGTGSATGSFDDYLVTNVPAVSWQMAGAVETTTAKVHARLDMSTDAALEYSTSSTFATSTTTSEVSTTAGNQVAQFSLTGLTANTQYYYRVVAHGVKQYVGGQFKTMPTGNASFSFVFGSCNTTASNNAVFTRIKERNALLFMHLGDRHYEDVDGVASQSAAYNAINAAMSLSLQKGLRENQACMEIYDDHDFGGNNTYKDTTGVEYARVAFRESVPRYEPVVDTMACPQMVVAGRVRIILLDGRGNRTNPASTDNSSKSMLGATQKQFLLDQILAAKNAGQVVCIASPSPWATTTKAGGDTWGGYTNERDQILAYIVAQDMTDSVFMLTGDNHAMAYYDTTTNTVGGFPVCMGSPFDQNQVWHTENITPTIGPIQVSHDGVADRQYGLIAVTDAGGSTISVDFTGIVVTSGTESTGIATQTFTREIPTASGGTSSGGFFHFM